MESPIQRFSSRRQSGALLEDAKGQSIQIEFTPTGAEFCLEANGTEGEVPYPDLARVAQLTAG